MFTLTTISHFMQLNDTHCTFNQLTSKKSHDIKHTINIKDFDYSQPIKLNASTIRFKKQIVNFETCTFSDPIYTGILPSPYIYNETGVYFQNGSKIFLKMNPSYFYPMEYALVNPQTRRYLDLVTGKLSKLDLTLDTTGFTRSLYYNADIYNTFRGENVTFINGAIVKIEASAIRDSEVSCPLCQPCETCPTTNNEQIKSLKLLISQYEKTIKELQSKQNDNQLQKKIQSLEADKAALVKKVTDLKNNEKECQENAKQLDQKECPKPFNVEKAKRLQKYQIALTSVGFVGVALFVMIV
ncbi:hypothetical protein SS50377_20250 [Spironucleus salmonicida]|uniref:Uncharacterized protein n=1 Tax=Spironucleus salmonicida TaxID=348837 RepID=V6LWX4_9EUKA|nr:hypothetical protein SS50377_20250 [Spironucleus salmonicida]|eukprot:EST45304.1 Hypothetical protein SS50377_14881 [Spironucleus salmonicida]